MKLFITGIGTDVGKTIASAHNGIEADYWKPIQVGDLENSDSHKVKLFCLNEKQNSSQ
jgi:dethiobiotin synthetase